MNVDLLLGIALLALVVVAALHEWRISRLEDRR